MKKENRIFIVYETVLIVLVIACILHISNGVSSNYSSSYTETYNTNDYSSSFTNKYGTKTTICAHSGCANHIASSGDTNCCTLHSNRCLNCYCYIDEDAMYCMSCLKNALK